MGISADLIEFGAEGDRTVDDLNSEISLYDALPSHLHQFISPTTVEVIDDDYYRDLFGDSTLVVVKWDSEDGVTYLPEEVYNTEFGTDEFDDSKFINVPYPLKTTEVAVNRISAKTLCYIGGGAEFKPDIYRIYHGREHFPYLWTWVERDFIMDIVPNRILEKVNIDNADNVFIDLGY